VFEAPETGRILDQALAGSLPEKLAQSLVRHHVLERIGAQLAASGELDRLVKQALDSPHTRELLDQVLASDEMKHAVRSLGSSPEVRHAIAQQSTGLVEELVGGVRSAAVRGDRRVGRPADPGYAGIPTRAAALALDGLAIIVIHAAVTGFVALIGSLVGGIRPHWLVGTLVGSGYFLIAAIYFVVFWSGAGQTPGMRLLRLRVHRPDGGGLSVVRSVVRVFGLAVAIIPFFAGFIPVLFDRRRRGLPDYLAGTVVEYDHVPE
jgi:uncharacterized RDD family membrane protein YckC